MFWGRLPFVKLLFGYSNNILARHHSYNIKVTTANTNISAKYYTVEHDNICDAKCNCNT